MAATGGDITEITFNHPTLGAGSFFPKANEGNTLDLGGIRNNDDTNMISGDGELINQKNRVRGFAEIVVANDLNTREDLLVASNLAADPVGADYTVSLINGTVYKCSGTIVGDISADINAATFTLKIATARFEKIVG